MSTSIQDDQKVSLAEAARLSAIDGRPLSHTTLWRWARFGRDGIKLRTIRRGGQLVTTARWLREFEEAVTDADARRWAERCADPIPDPNSDTVDAEARALGI